MRATLALNTLRMEIKNIFKALYIYKKNNDARPLTISVKKALYQIFDLLPKKLSGMEFYVDILFQYMD